MADSRYTPLLTGLLTAGVLLLLLALALVFLVPVVACPACIGWALPKGTPIALSYRGASRDCRFCKGTGKATLFKNWLITRKEGRPCYYIDHDE